MTHALKLVDLCVRRDGRPVIQNLTTTVAPASWLGVIGANGSGKTTLLRAVGGRLPIASGQCWLEGADVAADRSTRASAIGFAPPIDALPPLLTVRAVLQLAGDSIADQQRRNDRLWSALGIAGFLDRRVGETSSGLRQRVTIALAFATGSSIVILDEPFNWLDPVAAFDTRAALADKVDSGTTLITALHDLFTLCGFCDRGIVMAHGRMGLELGKHDLRAGERDTREFEQTMITALRG